MIPMSYANKFKSIRPELNRVKRLGHDVGFLYVREGCKPARAPLATIVAKGTCSCCGGTLIIERDRTSREADALVVCGDVLTMECVS